MAFKKGQPRALTAGRIKGTPNKTTTNLLEILNAKNFNPAEKLVELFESTEDEHVKANLLAILMRYIYPVRKAVEVTGQLDHKLAARVEELKNMTPEQLEEARIRALKLVSGKDGQG